MEKEKIVCPCSIYILMLFKNFLNWAPDLWQEIEKEKDARLELEKTARIHSVAASDQTPITRHNSAFENGMILWFTTEEFFSFVVSDYLGVVDSGGPLLYIL